MYRLITTSFSLRDCVRPKGARIIFVFKQHENGSCLQRRDGMKSFAEGLTSSDATARGYYHRLLYTVRESERDENIPLPQLRNIVSRQIKKAIRLAERLVSTFLTLVTVFFLHVCNQFNDSIVSGFSSVYTRQG